LQIGTFKSSIKDLFSKCFATTPINFDAFSTRFTEEFNQNAYKQLKNEKDNAVKVRINNKGFKNTKTAILAMLINACIDSFIEMIQAGNHVAANIKQYFDEKKQQEFLYSFIYNATPKEFTTALAMEMNESPQNLLVRTFSEKLQKIQTTQQSAAPQLGNIFSIDHNTKSGTTEDGIDWSVLDSRVAKKVNAEMRGLRLGMYTLCTGMTIAIIIWLKLSADATQAFKQSFPKDL